MEGTRGLNGLVGHREEENEHLEHENLSNDTRQCDKGGEFGE